MMPCVTHGREIRHRQRLPEEDAAIPALAVQRVHAVEHRDEQIDRHEEKRGDHVRLLDRLTQLGRPERRCGAHPGRQREQRQAETDQYKRGDDQRRQVDRAVLPQLSPHRPVQAPRC